MNTYYYTITYKGKKYCYETSTYGIKNVAHKLQIPKKDIEFGARVGLPLWPPEEVTNT